MPQRPLDAPYRDLLPFPREKRTILHVVYRRLKCYDYRSSYAKRFLWVSFETRIARSLFFYKAERKLIFTHGFVKKTQKTPKTEIARAKAIRQSWRA